MCFVSRAKISFRSMAIFGLFLLYTTVLTQNSRLGRGRIISEIFNSGKPYDKLTRPYFGVRVNDILCQYRINSVMDVVPKMNTFKVDLFLRLKWIDPRLKFTQIISEESLLVDPELVWKPDVYFFNEAGKPDILDRSLRLKPNGEILWNRHFIISLNSPFDMHDYPFDSQQLEFILMSYANSEKTMNLSYFESGPVYPSVATTFNSVLWGLDREIARPEEASVNLQGEPAFEKLLYSLQVSRQANIYILKYVMPLTIVMICTSLTYWVARSSIPARTSFCMAQVTASIALDYIIHTDMPKVKYATNLDKFVTILFLFDIIALLQWTIILFFSSKHKLICEKIDQSFRAWAPVMVLHALGLLLKSGEKNDRVKIMLCYTAGIWTLSVIGIAVISYRREVIQSEIVSIPENK
jgi:hypothetical protein